MLLFVFFFVRNCAFAVTKNTQIHTYTYIHAKILYGLALNGHKFRELEQISKLQSPNKLSVFADNSETVQQMIEYAENFATDNDFQWNVMIEVNGGTNRTGINITDQRTDRENEEFIKIAKLLNESNKTNFHGLYSYTGHSYDGTPEEIKHKFES